MPSTFILNEGTFQKFFKKMLLLIENHFPQKAISFLLILKNECELQRGLPILQMFGLTLFLIL